jgi:hypothetical protein
MRVILVTDALVAEKRLAIGLGGVNFLLGQSVRLLKAGN